MNAAELERFGTWYDEIEQRLTVAYRRPPKATEILQWSGYPPSTYWRRRAVWLKHREQLEVVALRLQIAGALSA